MLTDDQPRVTIAHLPTPLEPLPRLTSRLAGPELWVKRDDQTGLATGGNKTRKLEYLVADALKQEADLLITCGAAQSNHARQTAAAAAKFGLDSTLVLRGPEPPAVQGNLLLDNLLGAEVVWGRGTALDQRMRQVAEEKRSVGRRPYVVPYGGSNAIGICGYVSALEELLEQCRERDLHFDRIVFASSSGGTQAGLALAARELGYGADILGISVDLEADSLKDKVALLAMKTAAHLGLIHTFVAEDFSVNDDYLGGGYAVVGDLEREAIAAVAQAEGLLLDPVYTGRAFGGLLDLIRQGALDSSERILFWHTGGTGGLFGHADQL